MAYALVQSYPNSSLTSISQEKFTNTAYEHRVFYTSDSVDEVFAYYEKLRPGFTEEENGRYYNFVENRSIPAQLASYISSTGGWGDNLPATNVNFYEAGVTGTIIETSYSWPSP
jgi:hypothetical protein